MAEKNFKRRTPKYFSVRRTPKSMLEKKYKGRKSKYFSLRKKRSNLDEPAIEKNLMGIDVSFYQGNIDWELVAQSETKFVFIKATEGAHLVDSKFAANIDGARAWKIPCGAYHYFHPKIPLQDQLENFIKTVGRLQDGDLPPVLDLEGSHEWLSMGKEKRLQLIEQWAQTIRDTFNTEVILYMSPSFAKEVFENDEALSKFPLWIAHYTPNLPTVPLPWRRWLLWQSTNRGRVRGIATVVDIDWFNGSVEQLESYRRRALPC